MPSLGSTAKPRPRKPCDEAVAACAAKPARMPVEIGVVLAEPVGDRGLQVRRRGEGDELMRLGEHAHQRAAPRRRSPTFQPVSEKILPAEPILTVRSRMPGRAISGTMAVTVEDDMLPDLVADRDRVELDAERGEQVEVGSAERRSPVGFSGLLNSTTLVFGEKASRQHLLVEAPMRRRQRHELRHAAGAPHQRQIGVVHRLEQHDLVARRDQRQQRAGDRLGRARGDHDLAVGIEVEP